MSAFRGGGVRAARLGLRALAASLFALLALGVAERSPFVWPRYALVLDESPSVRRRFPGFAEEALEAWKAFDGGRHPVVAAGEHPGPEGDDGRPVRETDLQAALRAAASIGAPGVESRLLVATDGLAREDDLEQTLRLLRDRRARVFALKPPAAEPQARVVDLVAPERAFPGESVPVRVRVAATRPGPREVQLLRDGEPVAEITVAVGPDGAGEGEFLQEAERVGRVRYGARLSQGNTPAVSAELSVAQSPRVRWLSDDPAAAGALVGLLRGAGVEVELTLPDDLAAPAQELARDEVVVLDDLPAAAITETLAEALRAAVGGRGAGLVVLGGRKGLGSGEYAGTALETLLPARAGYQAPPPPESVSLVLALDTSFSMFYRGSGEKVFYSNEPRKIDVAKESAREVARIVRPGDRFGVLGNSTDIFWIAPLAEVADRDELLRRLEKVVPVGDGIYFYSVLHEAREALRRAGGAVRHVLVLCDAEDIDQYEVTGRGHSFELVREMAQEGMTLSILAIGRPGDKDVPFLRTAALLGRGDFYLVPRIVALPRYFVSEYRRLSSSRYYLEQELQPVVAEHALLPAGGAASFPPLSGMALLTAREGARTLLATGAGAPLLVTGEYGRGRTAVFAGDDGYRWASRWVGTPETRRFWLQLLFGAAPAGEAARGFASFIEADRGGEALRFFYAASDGAPPPWEALWALPAGPGAAGPPLRLDRVGLRSFRGRAALGAEGYRRVVVAEDAAGLRPLLTAGFRVPPAAEDLPAAPRWGAVERLVQETGGAWVDGPADLVPARRAAERLPLPLTVLCAAAGVLLLLAETVLRATMEE